ncbi:hypothetical protein G6F56_002702 [Rhizopus delemar]|nr:hypothetical protein G6F56_002702 [Rhizopus delemar]
MPSHLETVILNPSSDMVDFIKSVPSPDVHISNYPVEQLVREKIQSDQKSNSDQENTFFVGDLGEIFRQHLRWKTLFTRIEPFFAVKCNPDPMVLGLLASLGLGFDCASKSEIQQVLNAGVEPHLIMHTNPCKQASFVRFATQNNVNRMAFDNVKELHNIKKLHPDAELVLRILPNDSSSLCQLGLKSGAPLENVEHLLKTAKELELNVMGLSFYIDGGDSVRCARRVFDQAEYMGFNFTLLYVRGVDFNERIATMLGPMIDCLFPPEIRVIADTGGCYVTSAFTLCTNITGRRTIPHKVESGKQQYVYHISEGIYGSFNCILFDQPIDQPKVLVKDEEFILGQQLSDEHFDSSVWGPTCDPIDCLNKSVQLPILEPGDWLCYENMGAYSIRTASQFNEFKKLKIFYTNTLI